MKSIKLTIYEILGYLAPGSVALLAMIVLGWDFFFPEFPLRVWELHIGKEEFFLLLFLSYPLGHLVQGITNFHKCGEDLFEQHKDGPLTIEAAKRSLTARLGGDFSEHNCRQLSRLCQNLMLHIGKTDDHDVFLYREGYYRGSSAAFALLAVSLAIRGIKGTAKLAVKESVIQTSWPLWATLSGIAILFTIIFHLRFRRFASYRVANLLNFSFLPLPIKLSGEPDEKDAEGITTDASDAEE